MYVTPALLFLQVVLAGGVNLLHQKSLKPLLSAQLHERCEGELDITHVDVS